MKWLRNVLLKLLRFGDSPKLFHDDFIFNIGRNAAYYLIRNAELKALGRGISPHTLQQSTATILDKTSKNPLIIQMYLHHKDVRVTDLICACVMD